MICRRCLLADMESEKPLYDLMLEWLAAVPPEDKAAPEVYRARLEACRGCGELVSGLCGQCGCYVELRAAKKGLGCAGTEKKWERIP
jgi:hypothetical protein